MKLKICLLTLAILLSGNAFTMEKKDDRNIKISDASSDEDMDQDQFDDMISDSDEEQEAQVLTDFKTRSMQLKHTFKKHRKNRKNRKDRLDQLKNRRWTLDEEIDSRSQNETDLETDAEVTDLYTRQYRLIDQQNAHHQKSKELADQLERHFKNRRSKAIDKVNINQVAIIAGTLIGLIGTFYYFIKKFWLSRDDVNKTDPDEAGKASENTKK